MGKLKIPCPKGESQKLSFPRDVFINRKNLHDLGVGMHRPFPGCWCPALCSFWAPPSEMRLKWYYNWKKKFADDRNVVLTALNMNRWPSSRFLNAVPLQEKGDRRYNIGTCKNTLPLITALHCKCKWYVKLREGHDIAAVRTIKQSWQEPCWALMVLNILKGSDRHQFIVRLFMCFFWPDSALEACK